MEFDWIFQPLTYSWSVKLRTPHVCTEHWRQRPISIWSCLQLCMFETIKRYHCIAGEHTGDIFKIFKGHRWDLRRTGSISHWLSQHWNVICYHLFSIYQIIKLSLANGDNKVIFYSSNIYLSKSWRTWNYNCSKYLNSEHLLAKKQRMQVVLTSLQLNRIKSQELFPKWF